MSKALIIFTALTLLIQVAFTAPLVQDGDNLKTLEKRKAPVKSAATCGTNQYTPAKTSKCLNCPDPLAATCSNSGVTNSCGDYLNCQPCGVGTVCDTITGVATSCLEGFYPSGYTNSVLTSCSPCYVKGAYQLSGVTSMLRNTPCYYCTHSSVCRLNDGSATQCLSDSDNLVKNAVAPTTSTCTTIYTSCVKYNKDITIRSCNQACMTATYKIQCPI